MGVFESGDLLFAPKATISLASIFRYSATRLLLLLETASHLHLAEPVQNELGRNSAHQFQNIAQPRTDL